MIADVLSIYGTDVAPSTKSARNISYNIGNLLKWWHDKTAAEVNEKTCKAYAATKRDQGALADLKVLKAALLYWHRNPDYGPLESIPIIWRPDHNPPRERWLTRSEAARLLWAARKAQHLRRMILLGLYTGSRPGVLLAMQWDQVDLRGKTLSRTRLGQHEDRKKRAPKVRLGNRILAHLKRWKRLDGAIKHVCHYEGRPVQDPHGSWRRAVREAGLKGVTRHTLRHTRATWMMQKNVPIWEAAGFLGMTIKTLERVYAHHSPEHQDRAANA